jgi:hypothetical protein
MEGVRAVVEIDHLLLPQARSAWNGTIADAAQRSVRVSTIRTWGTLRGAKLWLRGPVRPAPRPDRPTPAT